MIEVLSVASEVHPLIKTGGLADVAGALPGALSAHGVNMRVLMPGYPSVMALMGDAGTAAHLDDLFGGPARLLTGHFKGLDLIVIDAPHLYDRAGGPYADATGKEFADNWQRFAALSLVGAELGHGLIEGYSPDILHAHDWQAALAPAYIAFGRPSRLKSVVTIHNLAFQGKFGADIFSELRLPPQAFAVDGVEYYGGVGFLKAGLQCADALTTVSPTYAQEIRTPDFGMGLDGLLNARSDVLWGILNGIDMDEWDPGTDPHLAANYRANSAHIREANKQGLLNRFGLEAGNGPLFGVVSRLTWQKGIDLLTARIDDLVAQGGQLCVLGSGETHLEAAIEAAVARHPGRVGFHKGYNEGLSHLIQGGADAVLVPSRFEPCGLTQLFGLRYGAIPVVARVGGLADTVIDANEAALNAGVATGVQFSPVTEAALGEAIRRTIHLYRAGKPWHRMQRRGMKSEVSWEASAGKYARLYRQLLGRDEDDDYPDD